jgi:hypothetical protein
VNRLQSFIRRGDLIVWVGLFNLSFSVRGSHSEVTGPVEIAVRVEDIAVPAKNSRICSIVSSRASFMSMTISG